ncbi:MAG TPA: GAP family protein [Thermomicrobiales bacterium]
MGDVILSLLPLIAGAAIVPIWIIIVLLLLSSQNGLARAGAFVAGATAVRLGQGIVLGALFAAADAAEGEDGGTSPVAVTLLLALGTLMLVSAARSWLKEDDPDAPPPKWMALLDSLTPLKAFGLGAALLLIGAKPWVFTLSAIGVISEADLSRAQNIVAYLFYVLAAQSLLLVAVGAYAVAPKRSAPILASAKTWLEAHNRQITIAVSVVFGALFVYKGIAGLLD